MHRRGKLLHFYLASPETFFVSGKAGIKWLSPLYIWATQFLHLCIKVSTTGGSHLAIVGWDQTYYQLQQIALIGLGYCQLQEIALIGLGYWRPNCHGHKVWFRDEPVSAKLWAAVGWLWETNSPVTWEQESVKSFYNHQEVSPRRQRTLGIKEKRGSKKLSLHIIVAISTVHLPLCSQLADKSLLVCEFQLGFLSLAAKPFYLIHPTTGQWN